MERLIQDIRLAARLLWRDRGFASAAILTLALCIGANGAIFAVIDRRTPMILATLFAVATLLLAVLGIYGVPAYQVTQRRREIGIRMALGSDARRVFSLVLGEGLTLMAVGLSAGLVGAFSVRRVLEAQLYEIGAMEPFVLTSVAAVVALMVVIACSVPARRAARIDPLAAPSDQ
jgi:ABC-type antimicrobial peptide transport system permease subunit